MPRHCSSELQACKGTLLMHGSLCARAQTACGLPTGIRHWGEKPARCSGALPKSERETLWHITHALSLLLDRDFPDGVATYSQSA